MSLLGGQESQIQQIRHRGHDERVDYSHADLELNRVEQEKHVLSDYQNAATDYYALKTSLSTPTSLLAVPIVHPSEILALFEHQEAAGLPAKQKSKDFVVEESSPLEPKQ